MSSLARDIRMKTAVLGDVGAAPDDVFLLLLGLLRLLRILLLLHIFPQLFSEVVARLCGSGAPGVVKVVLLLLLAHGFAVRAGSKALHQL